MRIFSIIILISFIAMSLNSATWERTFGGDSTEIGFSVIQDSEGYYVVAGYTESFGAGGRDIYVLKVDSAGDTIWTRTYGGAMDENVVEIFETDDGGYFLAGITRSFGAGDNDIYLLKINNNGDTIWTKTIGGDSSDVVNSIGDSESGGYILAGYTKSFDTTYQQRAYLVKVDSTGDTIWTKEYDQSYLNSFNSVDETYDNGFILTGMNSYYESYLIKLDSSGNELWKKSYDSLYIYNFKDVLESEDSGYVFIAHFDDCQYQYCFLIKVDTLGNIIWSDMENEHVMDDWYGWKLTMTKDGDYVYCGCEMVYSYLAGFIALKSKSGSLIWLKKYDNLTGTAFYSVYPTRDGGFIAVGRGNKLEETQIYLVKTDSIGEVGVEEEIPGDIPSNDILKIIDLGNRNICFKFTIPTSSNIKLEIFDISGRIISTPISGNLSPGFHEIPFKPERSGMYFYRLESEYLNETGKFTVLR